MNYLKHKINSHQEKKNKQTFNAFAGSGSRPINFQFVVKVTFPVTLFVI